MNDLPDRFWAKVDKSDGCWNWIAGKNHYGYGSFAVLRDGEWFRAQAHRVAYEALVGPIPEGLTLDHLCRNRGCVNPDHLEPVTRGANVLRGTSPAAGHARKTSCKNGHALVGANMVVNSFGARVCQTCRRARARRYYHGKRVAA